MMPSSFLTSDLDDWDLTLSDNGANNSTGAETDEEFLRLVRFTTDSITMAAARKVSLENRMELLKKKVSEPTPKGDSSSPGEAGTDQQDEHANGQDATQGKGETEKIDWRSQRIVGSVTDARGTSRNIKFWCFAVVAVLIVGCYFALFGGGWTNANTNSNRNFFLNLTRINRMYFNESMLHQIHSEFMEIRFKLDQILQRIAYQGSRHVERSSVGAQLVAASLFLLVVTSVLVAVGMWLPDVRQPHHQQQRSQQRRQQLSLPPPPSTRRSGVDWTRKTARPRKYFNVHEMPLIVEEKCTSDDEQTRHQSCKEAVVQVLSNAQVRRLIDAVSVVVGEDALPTDRRTHSTPTRPSSTTRCRVNAADSTITINDDECSSVCSCGNNNTNSTIYLDDSSSDVARLGSTIVLDESTTTVANAAAFSPGRSQGAVSCDDDEDDVHFISATNNYREDADEAVPDNVAEEEHRREYGSRRRALTSRRLLPKGSSSVEGVRRSARLLTAHSARRLPYICVSVDAHPLGCIVFRLYDNVAPIAAANFRALCHGWLDARELRRLPVSAQFSATSHRKLPTYRGARFDYVSPSRSVGGGNISGGNGLVSAYGGPFAQEPAMVRHADRAGLLCMCNMSGLIHSRFYITAGRFRRNAAVIGEVVAGMEVVRRIEQCRCTIDSFTPTQDIRITECGTIKSDPRANADGYSACA